MSVPGFLAGLKSRLKDLALESAPWARGAWCRKQRRHLRGSHSSVVWVRGDAVSWAEWGARRGYFDVQYMDGLAYLSATPVKLAA